MNLAANGVAGLPELAQRGMAQFLAIARLLFQLPAPETTCERVISTMWILLPKS
jgi:hypothetical protein